MADFTIPFANTGEKRPPTAGEKEDGFECGPADQRLFNGLFHRLEAEMGEVMSHAGITGTDDRHTLLRESIVALINAATGGGDTSQFVLMNQLRSRLPFYPEITTGDGKLSVTYDAGSSEIVLAAGGTFMHRGIYEETTSETRFALPADNTVNHLRWNPTTGYSLSSISALTEADAVNDSSYDDMLIARVVTGASATPPSITELINKHELDFTEVYNVHSVSTATNGWKDVPESIGLALNWARTPRTLIPSLQFVRGSIHEDMQIRGSGVSGIVGGHNLMRIGFQVGPVPGSRYALPVLEYQYEDSTGDDGRLGFIWHARA